MRAMRDVRGDAHANRSGHKPSPLSAIPGSQPAVRRFSPPSPKDRRRARGCPIPIMWAPFRTDALIKSPKEAINVFDFEPVCRANVPPAHFGYMASGIDDEVTLARQSRGLREVPSCGRAASSTSAKST